LYEKHYAALTSSKRIVLNEPIRKAALQLRSDYKRYQLFATKTKKWLREISEPTTKHTDVSRADLNAALENLATKCGGGCEIPWIQSYMYDWKLPLIDLIAGDVERFYKDAVSHFAYNEPVEATCFRLLQHYAYQLKRMIPTVNGENILIHLVRNSWAISSGWLCRGHISTQ